MRPTGLWLILASSLLALACEVKLYTGDDDDDDTTEEGSSNDDDSVVDDDDDTTTDDDDDISGGFVEREIRFDSFSRFVWLEREDQPEPVPLIEASPRPSPLSGYAEDFIALSGVLTPEEPGRVFPNGAYLEFNLNDGLPEPMQYWFEQLVLRKRVKGSEAPNYLTGELGEDGTIRFKVTQLDTWVLGWKRTADGIWSLVSSLCKTPGDDACNTLLLESCGNGWVQSPAEQCDGDAACQAGCYVGIQRCDLKCQRLGWCDIGRQRCGDRITDGCEVCDDGTYLGEGVEGACLSDCTGRQHCGNGVIEGGETCDESISNGQCGHCNADCSGWSACPDNPVKSIWSGRERVCLIREDGSLLCSGNNHAGLATPIEGQFKSVAFTNAQTCALDLEGRPRCWGQKIAFPEEDRYLALVAGYGSWCALRVDRSLVCVGGGDASSGFPPAGPFESIAMSENSDYACALRPDGTLACWGEDVLVDYGPPPTGVFKSVSVGNRNACALPEDGIPVCWGHPGTRITEVPSIPLTTLALQGDLACGLDAAGHMQCWGGWKDGSEVQAPEGEFVPLEGNGLSCAMQTDGSGLCIREAVHGNWNSPPAGLAQMSGGLSEMCLLTESGYGTCWGTLHPEWPDSDTKFIQISHPDPECGILANHQLNCASLTGQPNPAGEFDQIRVSMHYGCGIRRDGRLACGFTTQSNFWTAPVEGRFLQVSAGPHWSCAISEGQEIICWDYNGRPVVTPLKGLFMQVETDGNFTCGLHPDGSIDCYFILEEPQSLYSFPGPVSTISHSYDDICGLDPERNAVCWNLFDAQSSAPVPGPFKTIRATNNGACAIRMDGTLTCWGDWVR